MKTTCYHSANDFATDFATRVMINKITGGKKALKKLKKPLNIGKIRCGITRKTSGSSPIVKFGSIFRQEKSKARGAGFITGS